MTEFTPYIAFLSRPKTGDLGFGLGIGIPLRTTVAERTVTIASETADSAPATTNESGVSLELQKGTNSWALIVGLTPVLNGKIKQKNAEDVDHKSSEYSVHFETYGLTFKSRAGLVIFSATDDYEDDALKESGYKVSGRLDFRVSTFNVIPYLDYTSMKRTRGDVSGDLSETEIGGRLSWSAVYAPFVALGINLKSEEQTSADDRDVKTDVGGVRLAGGLNI